MKDINEEKPSQMWRFSLLKMGTTIINNGLGENPLKKIASDKLALLT
jgi:hypothetical protein